MRPNLTGQSPNPNKPAGHRGQVLFINADAEFYAGRAQNYLHPEHVEKIVSTFDRYEDVPAYARVVPLGEIASATNDFNLNIRRYVDNSPPPEPHDVRAHLLGGVPVVEVTDKRPLFDALGFHAVHAFALRNQDPVYFDFAPVLTDRVAIRPLLEGDSGVQARQTALGQRLAGWWTEHSPRLADLPRRRDLNQVRAEFLDTFVTALLQDESGAGSPPLDRFKLAGVIATWWTDTLPDFKTLLENGFPGVLDGWVDAIADAVDDDEAANPGFEPFGHKLVRRTMADYLDRIAATKADIARLKGEKETFEQSNAPDDLDEEELAAWNYAKDLDRQTRELKAEHKDALKTLARLEKAATRDRATAEVKRAAAEEKAALQLVLDQLSALETALAPYEQIKTQLAEARARYRTLTAEFVDELKSRCSALTDDQKRALVLELFAQDVQVGLDGAVAEKRRELVRFIEGLWDKYFVPMGELSRQCNQVSEKLAEAFKKLNYVD
jgi:type I restriction enzyme M protein